MKICECRWGDAWINTIDIDLKEAEKLKPLVRYSVGFLVTDNEESLVLCTDYYEEDKTTVNAPMVIPKGMIIDYWVYEIIEESDYETKGEAISNVK